MIEYTVIVFNNGDKKWYVNGKLHREDGPAVEWSDGTKQWWVNGERHREDGPAIECANGDKSWWVNGELHRLDGPAVECANGDKEWWVNGDLHRLDGPAVEWASGNKGWYVNGKLHREDGPAIERSNGDKEWWVNGKKVTEEEHKHIPSHSIRLKDYEDFVGSMVITHGHRDRLAENALGLVGEAGEVAEKIKKYFRDSELDKEAVQKELGDVIFYWYAIHGALGLDPEGTIRMNIENLSSRKERGVLQGSGDNR